MGAVNKRGIWVPGTGDDLLAAWQTMAGRLGVFVPVASVAAARALLDEAQSAGIGASTSNPITFQIGSGAEKVVYTANGTKTNGVWVLAPINEVAVADDTYMTAWSGYRDFTVASQAQSLMMKTSLAAAPMDRRVTAQVAAYGQKKAGAPLLRLKMHDGRLSFGRFDVDPDTATTPSLSCVIPANEAPSIEVHLHGGTSSGNSTVYLSGDERMSALMVTAFPITMNS